MAAPSKSNGQASCRTVGERINYVRSERNLSWAEIDRRANLTPGHARTLWRRASIGRTDTIKKIAVALGVPFDWLATGNGPAPTKSVLADWAQGGAQ